MYNIHKYFNKTILHVIWMILIVYQKGLKTESESKICYLYVKVNKKNLQRKSIFIKQKVW